MKFAEAFKQTMFHFDLVGSEIAEKSGIPPSQISNFRRGKNLRIDTVERILDVLPQEAKVYMLNLVAQPSDNNSLSVTNYELDEKNLSDG